MKPLAPSFDTVGWYGRSVDDLALIARVLVPGFPHSDPGPERLRLAYANTPKLAQVAPGTRVTFMAVCERLQTAGYSFETLALPDSFGELYEAHRVINDAEGGPLPFR